MSGQGVVGDEHSREAGAECHRQRQRNAVFQSKMEVGAKSNVTVCVLCVMAEPLQLFVLFQDGKYKQASVQYKRIVTWLEHESGLSEEDEKKAKALRLAAHLNLAMCCLKVQELNQALENCDKVAHAD